MITVSDKHLIYIGSYRTSHNKAYPGTDQNFISAQIESHRRPTPYPTQRAKVDEREYKLIKLHLVKRSF